ncbi:unnamed protein product [Arctia plantaginis]|uniref:Cytochrome P450 n=1 Tax=Arctia plantaginis TaxID=874455 RepID=A0A8S1B4S7_ARCPL|nr:unnamed protein product [Arctia plantaginis]
MIVVFDGDIAAEMYHRENMLPLRPAFFSFAYFKKYHNRPKDQHTKPSGLVTENGENWKWFRSKVNSTMLDPKNVQRYSTQIDEVALDMIERIRSLRDHNNVFCGEFDKEMNLWALESVAVIALGRRINCFAPKTDDVLVEKLINCTHELFEIASNLDYKPSIWKYYATKNFKNAMQVYGDIEYITKHYVNMTLENLKTKANNTHEEKSILEKLLEIDENVAHIMSMDMLVAGIDTTSNTLSATLYLLATHPKIQQKLRDNILLDPKTPYLTACIKESMRMRPVAGLNVRETTKDYEILGYNIPKGTSLLFCHQYMSTMEKHFPKANEYIPERWLSSEKNPMYPGAGHKFASLPFGFGSRSCIGQRIADLELKTFLSRLIEKFEISWFGDPPKIHPTHINQVISPNNFIFKDI